jgi:predicted Zn-dependent peptidase
MHFPIERFTLPNGLRVVLSEDRSLPVVAVNLWYNVGSRNERPGRTGFAHLFEHMMFQGSAHVPDTGHIAQVERAGGSVNGSTWLDRTNYYQTLPSNHLDLALWLESDRMGFLAEAMTQEKLDNQREVVKNERRWRVDNQPYGDWDERLQAMVFPADHPYHHSVIGSMDDLDAASLDDVIAFFRTYYAPNNAVLSLCGDFEAQAARDSIDRYFGPLPRGPELPPLPGRVEIPPTLEREIRTVVRSVVALPRVYMAMRVPVFGSPGFYAAETAAHLLAGGKASRLYGDLVRTRRLAQDVAAFVFPVVTGSAMVVLWATAAPDADVGVVEAALRAHLVELAGAPARAAEVERAILATEAQHTISLQQVGTRADQLSMFTTQFDAPDRINTELDRYRAVAPKGVQELAGSFLNPDRAAVLVYLPAPPEGS